MINTDTNLQLGFVPDALYTLHTHTHTHLDFIPSGQSVSRFMDRILLYAHQDRIYI